jgi:hypothetical protein
VHWQVASALPAAACGTLLCTACLHDACHISNQDSPASIWKVLLPYRFCRSSADMSCVQLSTCTSPPQAATDHKQGLGARLHAPPPQLRCQKLSACAPKPQWSLRFWCQLAPPLRSVAKASHGGDCICRASSQQALAVRNCRWLTALSSPDAGLPPLPAHQRTRQLTQQCPAACQGHCAMRPAGHTRHNYKLSTLMVSNSTCTPLAHVTLSVDLTSVICCTALGTESAPPSCELQPRTAYHPLGTTPSAASTKQLGFAVRVSQISRLTTPYSYACCYCCITAAFCISPF